MQIPNLEDLIGASEQDYARVLEEAAREEHKRRAEESLRRYKDRSPKGNMKTTPPGGWRQQEEETLVPRWIGDTLYYYRLRERILAQPVTTNPLNPKRLPGS